MMKKVLPSKFLKLTSKLDDSLLKPKYRGVEGSTPVTGHCYIVSEALYHLWGKEEGYTPRVLRCPDGDTHWFLQRGTNIVDLTVGQFKGDLPDYTQGRACGFLTKIPSKRAKILIERFYEEHA